MEADINGAQRKVVTVRVAPLRSSFGDSGIPIRKGRTLPFRLEREWSAPAGRYAEQWFLVQPDTREVLHEGPVREVSLFGLQALTDVVDEVAIPIELEPGTYQIFFALNGLLGGQFDVEAIEAPAEAA
ncbi:MAG: hypothetical protein M3174_05530 [Actinomycetota bacterium]|nr:hypothetical protein [Actinomycetota bacterium]